MSKSRRLSPGDLVFWSYSDGSGAQSGIVISVSEDEQVVQIALNVENVRNELIVRWDDDPKTKKGDVLRLMASSDTERARTFASRLLEQTEAYIRGGGRTDYNEGARLEHLVIASDLRDQLARILPASGSSAMLPQGSRYFFARPLFAGRDFAADPRFVFVLMPFRESLRPVFSDHILKVCQELGLNCKRADDIFRNTSIIEDIWEAINTARVIIADLTGKNANVYYEIGMAHTIGKSVILLTQAIEDVPFDLRHLRHIQYEYTPRGMQSFEERLKSTIVNVLELESAE